MVVIYDRSCSIKELTSLLMDCNKCMDTKHTIDANFTSDNKFVSEIIQIIRDGKDKAYTAVNASMIDTYWSVGRRIVLEEQKGELRVEYGTQLLKRLASSLTKELGKGYTSNSPTMRFGTQVYRI